MSLFLPIEDAKLALRELNTRHEEILDDIAYDYQQALCNLENRCGERLQDEQCRYTELIEDEQLTGFLLVGTNRIGYIEEGLCQFPL